MSNRIPRGTLVRFPTATGHVLGVVVGRHDRYLIVESPPASAPKLAMASLCEVIADAS